ncbi:BGTF surface domain-containing protein [Halorubrum aethiopicum]|uniref:BGTF surface domain-containing protein n=1 Tax=Halorubrum aethiopicum TaxID=1758255 RepID=UPI000831EF2B|nr:BGTF surface domain-containing protein [Halorubrum aethiopicum]
MTNDNNSTRKKANAVFFSLIVVLSMVGVGFAGSATALGTNDDYLDVNGDEKQGGVVFQGQDLYLVGDSVNGSNGATVNLRRVTEYNDSNAVTNSEQVEQLTVEALDSDFPSAVGSGGQVVEIDTDDLEAGDYFVRGVGDLAVNPQQSETFEVTVQDLSAEFDDEEVTDEGANSVTELDVSSDRGTYSTNVSANGDLSETELINVLVTGENVDVDSNGYINGSTITPSDAVTVQDLRNILVNVRGNVSVDDAGNPTLESSSTEIGDSNITLDEAIATDANPFGAVVYNTNEEDADEKVGLYQQPDTAADVSFAGVDTGDYEFNFDVGDTEASDNASITVNEQDTTGDFSQGVYTQTAGDVVNMTLELEDTDDAYIQVGDEESGFVDVLYVEDDDDDGEVTFQVNTRLLGTYGPDDDVYNTEDDIVESLTHGGISDADDVPRFEDEDGNGIGFNGYLEQLDLIDSGESPEDQLVRPLQPTSYEVAANGNDLFVVNEDDESELDNEIDLATLELTEPGVGNIQTWTAPSDNADADTDLQDVLDTVNQTSEIAEDDRLVIQAEATGIYGHMVAIDDDGFDALNNGFSASTLDTLDNREGEGVNIEIEADDATGNQDATSLDLAGASESDIIVLVDNDSGQMFIVVDTSSSDAFDGTLDPDAEFTAEIEYEGDADNRFEFNGTSVLGGAGGDSTEAAFPYFQAGDDVTQTSTGDFTIAERDATFDNMDGEEVQVALSESATVSGMTNVAPGSDASVRIQSAEGVSPSFVETSDVQINSDGTFSAEFDVSAQSVNDTGTVSFRVDGSSVADSDMRIVETVGEPANFAVSDLNPQDVTVTSGDVIDVSATVENTGENEATQTVTFQVGGNTIAEQDVTLDGGESMTVEFTDIDTSSLDAGDYEHGVFTDDDSQTATLTVEAADTGGDDGASDDGETDDGASDDGETDDGASDDGETDDGASDDGETDDGASDDGSGDDGSTDDSTPGFGALVALVALIAAALLATRRRD